MFVLQKSGTKKRVIIIYVNIIISVVARVIVNLMPVNLYVSVGSDKVTKCPKFDIRTYHSQCQSELSECYFSKTNDKQYSVCVTQIYNYLDC